MSQAIATRLKSSSRACQAEKLQPAAPEKLQLPVSCTHGYDQHAINTDATFCKESTQNDSATLCTHIHDKSYNDQHDNTDSTDDIDEDNNNGNDNDLD